MSNEIHNPQQLRERQAEWIKPLRFRGFKFVPRKGIKPPEPLDERDIQMFDMNFCFGLEDKSDGQPLPACEKMTFEKVLLGCNENDKKNKNDGKETRKKRKHHHNDDTELDDLFNDAKAATYENDENSSAVFKKILQDCRSKSLKAEKANEKRRKYSIL